MSSVPTLTPALSRPAGEGVLSSRRFAIALVIAAALVLPFVVSNYRSFQFTLVLVYAIALLGLNILTGYNGQISLGHAAFYAVGAYTSAIMIDKWNVPYADRKSVV